MVENSARHFDRLFVKVKKLLQLTSALQLENFQLRQEVKRLKDARSSEAPDQQQLPDDVEQQLVQLRKENKVLKDREKLIRNKVDRLSVKLEDLQV